VQERIQKILAHGGIASRRAAEELIRAGRVRVNGKIVTELGAKANPRHDRVEVDGKRVVAEEPVYIVLHKPRGVVSTMSDPEGRPSVKELLSSIPGRVYPVGRLDFATSGVLLITNDGELHDGLLHPKKAVPKTYVLKVKGSMKPEDLEHWRKGVRLEDGMTLPAQAKLLRHEADKTWLELTIREGRNQQIRRMGEATGFPVMRLARVAFAEISAEGLAPGRWRHLTREELVALKKEYGVPRSIPASTADAQPARRIQARAVNVRGAVKGAAGRAQRNMGAEASTRGPTASADSRAGSRAENWGNDARSERGRAGAERADRGPRAGAGAGEGARAGAGARGRARPAAREGRAENWGTRGPRGR
jgi:23S rRNA pseudouridine2605 synthase